METFKVELPSSDGWNLMAFHINGRVIEDEDVIDQVTLELRGSFWDRRQVSSLNPTYELVDDFSVNLHQVMLPESKLRLLLRRLEQWLEHHEEFELDLTGDSGQKMRVCVSPRDEIISKADKPVFTLHYDTSRVKITCAFVIDQSGVSLFIEQMTAWFSSQ